MTFIVYLSLGLTVFIIAVVSAAIAVTCSCPGSAELHCIQLKCT